MSEEVDFGVWPRLSLGPGQDAWWVHSWGSMFSGGRWQSMSGSPDSYPSSLQIVEQWAYTDETGGTHLEVHWRNNGSNIVVWRPKAIIGPNH